MLMPFGKYKGHDLSALPDDYLLWLIANVPLRDPLRSAVSEEITERDLTLPLLPSPPARPPQLPKRPRNDDDDGKGAWTMGGDPQEIIAGDFPMSSRQRSDV
jgi:Putative quorum-sensing-regulated virulence factor